MAEQRHAGIVDEDVEAAMGRYRSLRERLNLRGLADIKAMHGDLDLPPFSAAASRKPTSSRSDSARSRPRAASSSESARPMPLAAPVTAAAAPRIAVIVSHSKLRRARPAFIQPQSPVQPGPPLPQRAPCVIWSANIHHLLFDLADCGR